MKNADSTQGKSSRKSSPATPVPGAMPPGMVMAPPPAPPMVVLTRSGFLALSTRPGAVGSESVANIAPGTAAAALRAFATISHWSFVTCTTSVRALMRFRSLLML